MTPVLLSVRGLAAHYGRREVFRDVSFDLRASHSLGVLGEQGAGKTTLLRMIVGCVTPASGDVRIRGRSPADALATTPVAYFAGGCTLPPFVRAATLGTLGNGDAISADRRRIRALADGARQLLGLRTALSRPGIQLAVLDEPSEGLDAEGARWLSATLEMKRDRGAAVVVSSHRLHDVAGLCDVYLFLLPHTCVLLKAHEISPVGPVTGALLEDVFARVRDRTEAIARQQDAPLSRGER
jgi:ABC-type multidrug transport system ATPase subunit